MFVLVSIGLFFGGVTAYERFLTSLISCFYHNVKLKCIMCLLLGLKDACMCAPLNILAIFKITGFFSFPIVDIFCSYS